MVIMEYCRYGILKDVLEKHRQNVKNQSTDSNTVQMSKSRVTGGSVSVTRKNLASWSYQIAQGMHFLASQKIVHGNLAARSILLADRNIAKISDFGLARAMYKVDAYIAEKEVKIRLFSVSVCVGDSKQKVSLIFVSLIFSCRANLNTNGCPSNRCRIEY